MPDAFEALSASYRRAPYPPTDPDPGFAARLRARLEQALTLPEGVDVTVTTLETELAPETETAAPLAAAARMAITPYLAVAGAARALDWYADAFGARRRMEPIVMPDGRIGHAELDFGGAVVMLADEFPEIGHTAPRPGAGSGVSLHIEVPDVDAVVDRAVEAGATLDRPPADGDYGRNAVIVDPFGHRWQVVAAPSSSAAPSPVRHPGGTRHGDVGYLSFQVPDLGRAQAFYGSVLGWEFAPAEMSEARMVVDAMPTMSVLGGQAGGDCVLCWRVDDVVAAADRVRRAGGTATEPDARPYGTVSDCVDDQGMVFYLWQPTEADARATADVALGRDRPDNGAREGDVAYLTIGVVDSARFRSFFGSVLGWRFTPGHAVDGWNVEDTMPMSGLHGGQDRAGVEPMYRVDDIHATVDKVRRAGGRAGAVEQMPYGLSAHCADDQGIAFYLGQL
ncbi:MAG: hypothetical protein QOD63_1600 [Actinomycetota bacterium]|jgi:predicted enzyme related to lactoylglutathione lyase|nr:hypothetical protein [Actinomycetota bacterium]